MNPPKPANKAPANPRHTGANPVGGPGWIPLIFGVFLLGAVLAVTMESHVDSSLGDTSPASAGPVQSRAATPRPSAKTGRSAEPAISGLQAGSEPAPVPPKPARREPGTFRGDWGETPTYQKNDRVNYQRAGYLSLQDDNHNQPPDMAPDFWKRVRPAPASPEAACQHPGPGAQLGECDFTEAVSLNGLDLSGADLSKARLSGDLGAANLSGANLSRVAVLGTLTIGPETRLDHANLSGLQSGGNNPLVAERADLTGTDFSKATLYGAHLRAATLDNANLSGATLTGADLTGTRLDKADLRGSDLSFAQLATARLPGASLAQADLTQADLSGADFSGAGLGAANLAGAQIAGADFSGADLRGANFADAQGADTAQVDARTDFTGAVCPDSARVDGVQATTCVGHGF